MDAKDRMTPPPSVLLPTVSSLAIARGCFNRALSSLLLCRSLRKTDQASIVTTEQRQVPVELFRGVAMLSQEVSPLAKRLAISLAKRLTGNRGGFSEPVGC